jgi:hypothetical protein
VCAAPLQYQSQAGVCEHYGIDPESIDLSSQRQYEISPVTDHRDGLLMIYLVYCAALLHLCSFS